VRVGSPESIVREVHTDHGSISLEQISGPSNSSARIIHVVKDAAEKDRVVGPITPVVRWELTNLIIEFPSLTTFRIARRRACC